MKQYQEMKTGLIEVIRQHSQSVDILGRSIVNIHTHTYSYNVYILLKKGKIIEN